MDFYDQFDVEMERISLDKIINFECQNIDDTYLVMIKLALEVKTLKKELNKLKREVRRDED